MHFFNHQALKKMSEEDRKAFLEERARREAEELAAAEAKARAESPKAETVRASLRRIMGLCCAALVSLRPRVSGVALTATAVLVEAAATRCTSQSTRIFSFGSGRKIKHDTCSRFTRHDSKFLTIGLSLGELLLGVLLLLARSPSDNCG